MAATKAIHAAGSSCSIIALLVLMAITVHGVQRAIIKCQELPMELCTFSVSSSGNKCVLEKVATMDGTLRFQCQSSVAMAEKVVEWIESEDCINARSLERLAVSMSIDSLHEPEFRTNFCSADCSSNCPNIVDLYINLAAGEGRSLRFPLS